LNDNGTILDQVGTYNKYQINYDYQRVNFPNNTYEETISIKIIAKDLATEYYTNETNCAKIN